MKFGIILCALFFLAAPLSAISIDKVKSNPQRYNGDSVRLRGEVTLSVTIPFTDLSVYILEDNSGSILVFSAYRKEKNERISIRAEVVAYVGSENESNREETIDRMTDYLVEKDILQRNSARIASAATLNIINSLADAATGTWFVIELEKSGFLSL